MALSSGQYIAEVLDLKFGLFRPLTDLFDAAGAASIADKLATSPPPEK